MNDQDANHIIFLTLDEIRPIATARLSMWPINDKYARLPCFRFRFKDTNKDDAIYTKVQETLGNYPGSIKWTLLTRDEVLNYIMVPEKFKHHYFDGKGIEKDELLTYYSEQEYKNIIDLLVLDIPNLASHIASHLPSLLV